MSNKKVIAKDKIVFDHVAGVMVAFKDGKKVTGDFMTRRKDKSKRTIEFSEDGRDWEVLPYEEEGILKTDDNYDPELDPNEQNKNTMISPAKVRVTKGYM